MAQKASQPLNVLSDPPERYQVLRELEHIHKTVNDRFNQAPRIIKEDTNLEQEDSGQILLVETRSAIRIRLPKPKAGLNFMIKDRSGLAATNNIKILPYGSEEIDGVSGSITISTNFGSKRPIADDTDWFLF